MNVPYTELIEAIAKLNTEVYNQTGDHGVCYTPFVARLDGVAQIVDMFGVRVWDSADDGRAVEGQDPTDGVEPLEMFLRRCFNEFSAELISVKL